MGNKRKWRQKKDRRREARSGDLAVTVQGAEEETPEQWADLVEYVLSCGRRRARERPDGKEHDDAA